ncbi:MAG: hypothetical protein JO067_01630 [Cupriavidus sp.]|nr:hypothetical protein [Cupriavidus sp.]
MTFGMMGSFAGGLVDGATSGLKMAEQWNQIRERQNEEQLAKDSAEQFKKLGKPDYDGFEAGGGQYKVGDLSIGDKATADKFAGDKDLADFATDGANNPANSAPQADAAPSQGISEADANMPIGEPPAQPASVTQTKLDKPLPVQTLDRAGNAAAPKPYGMQDYLNFRAQRAGELGLGKQAEEAAAKAIASQFGDAALRAYQQGNYTDVYKLHNMLPDGYTVHREVVPANADGTGGGVKLTMTNDKTGQVWGQPMTFGSDREAAGAFVAAAQNKLTDWLIQSGRQDNDVLRMMTNRDIQQQLLRQRSDAQADRNFNQLFGLVSRINGGGAAGSGSGTGSRGGKGAISTSDDPRLGEIRTNLKDFGQGQDGNKLGFDTTTALMEYAARIGGQNKDMPTAQLQRLAMAAATNPKAIKPEVDPATGNINLTIRDPRFDDPKTGDNQSTPYVVQRNLPLALGRQQGLSDTAVREAADKVMANMPEDQRKLVALAASGDAGMKQATKQIEDTINRKAQALIAANPDRAEDIKANIPAAVQNAISSLPRFVEWQKLATPVQAQRSRPTVLGAPAGLQAAADYVPPAGSPAAKYQERRAAADQTAREKAARDDAARVDLAKQFDADRQSMSGEDFARKYDNQRMRLSAAQNQALNEIEHALR